MKPAAESYDIRKEPLILKKWSLNSLLPSTFSSGLLVTGPNSFTGVHMVKLLKEKWPGKIHLLLRATSKQEALQKMNSAFEKWQLGPFKDDKVDIYLGDVCAPVMGLKTADYSTLQKNTGFVLHLAMNPIHHLPYSHFKRLWVPELQQMISFCGDKKYPKSLHYPSSLNAELFTSDKNFEQLDSNAWLSGYAGFKWVAARAIKNAFNQHLKGCLYDIPLVLGSSEKGLSPRQYTIWHMLDLFLKTKCYIPFQLKIIPVDVLSELMVQNILDDLNDKAATYLRPLLDEAVSDGYLRNMTAILQGLHETRQAAMRLKCANKERFDFIFPPDFHSLLDKVNNLHAVFPGKFDKTSLPSGMMVFVSNLNQVLSNQKKISIE